MGSRGGARTPQIYRAVSLCGSIERSERVADSSSFEGLKDTYMLRYIWLFLPIYLCIVTPVFSAGPLGWDSVPERLKKQEGVETAGKDILFATGAAQAWAGDRSDKAHEIAKKKSLLQALTLVHLTASCHKILAGLKPEEHQQFYNLFAAMAPKAHVKGLTVIRQWENKGRYFTTVAVPLAALENIPCEFPDLFSAITSYVNSDHVSPDGLSFCLRHVPRYSLIRSIIRQKIGRLYQDRGLNVLAASFVSDQLPDWGNSSLGTLAFQHRLTQAAQLTDHAKQMAGQGKWDEALKNVAKALDLVPTYSRAYLLLANYFLQQGKPEFVLCAAEKALRDGTSFRDAIKKIISCLEELNSTEAEVFRYLLDHSNYDQTYPQDWENEISQLADAHALVLSLVIESTGQAVEGPSRQPSAEFNQAVALFQQSKNDDDILRSLALLISACEKQPFSAKTYNLIGVCYRHLGKPAVALPFLWQALKLKPEYDFALTNLGLCCQSLGLMEAARYYFEYDAVKNSTNGWVQESYAKFVETIKK